MIRFRLEVVGLTATVASDRDDLYPDFLDDLMNRCVRLMVDAAASLEPEDEEADRGEGVDEG